MGDFYEMFGDDAERVGRALGLTISSRSSPIPMAGVPHHQLPTYLQRAIDAGFRVAVVDQLQDPKEAKGVVDRGVTQVVTPGTLVDDALLDDESTACLAAVCFDADDAAGIAVVELSTGAFWVLDDHPARLADELARLRVREVLYAETGDAAAPPRTRALAEPASAATTPRPVWHFRQNEALEAVRDHYRSAGVEGFGLDPAAPCVRAAGAVLRYLEETQAVGRSATAAASGSEFQRQASTLAHLSAPRRIEAAGVCRLDAVSLRALEVERTIRTDRAHRDDVEGSLLGVFLRAATGPRCVVRTPMGKRLLREWLVRPLTDLAAIESRQDAVALLSSDAALAEALAAPLDDAADLARIAGRVALGRATPRDLVAAGRTVAAADAVAGALAGAPAMAALAADLAEAAAALAPLAADIARSCVDDPPAHLREGGLIRDGVDAALDEARSLAKDAGAWLADYQTRLIAEHSLPSLKVGFNKVFGYFIELPAAQARRAPDALTRTQTLKNAERYTTPELRAFEQKVTTAEARALSRERELFDALCERARAALAPLTRTAELLATVDCLAGFAAKARQRGWVRPRVVDGPTLEIDAGRHPVLDELLDHRFVPNDTALATPEHAAPLALITGPNMAGKSTYIRQNALLALLAMTGSFVPAQRAVVGVCDRIFTRVGADDALHRGQSTFMVEMTETATILNNATPRSLVVLDEIGRGTSTLDGLSLAWAIAEHLADLGCRTLFATHYHELTSLEERLAARVRNLHVAVNEWTLDSGRTEIVFLHHIRPGRADRSYGVHVAELAGVPQSVVERARAVLDTLSVQNAAHADTQRIAPARERPARRSRAESQLGLFTEFVPHPVVDRLRECKLDALTPLQAFDLLRALRDEARDAAPR
jgi:DNA mismatch repair protein MutS